MKSETTVNGEGTGRDGGSNDVDPRADKHAGGQIVRIATALGTFTVEIVNELGPAADPLTADVERSVLDCLRAHRHLVRETAVAEIQRGQLDSRTVEL